MKACKLSGYTVVTVRSLEEVLKFITQSPVLALLADCSASETEAAERLLDLDTTPELFSLSVLFMAKRATRRAETVRPKYRNFIPIDIPYKMEQLLERFDGLKQHAPVQLTTPAKPRVSPPGLPKAPAPTSLVSSYGGKILAAASDESCFDDELILPSHPEREVIRNALNEISQSDPWLGIHSRRTAFVSSVVANSLLFEEGRDANVRTSGLILNLGLLSLPKELRRFDLFGSNAEQLDLLGISAAIKRSAEFAKTQIHDDRAWRTLRVIADLILGNKVVEDPDLVQEAECTIATELVDRACWRDGLWSLNGAHRAMRFLRKPKFFSDKSIIEGLARVLGEAVSSSPAVSNRYSRFLSRRQRSELQRGADDAVRDSERSFSKDELLQVELHSLKPGMKLGRPIFAADGAVVLPAGTQMDDDALLRLWELAAVRALRSPASIVVTDRQTRRRKRT